MRDVAALVAAFRVGGVAPWADAVPIWVPAIVQLQAVTSRGGPPGADGEEPCFKPVVPKVGSGDP